MFLNLEFFQMQQELQRAQIPFFLSFMPCRLRVEGSVCAARFFWCLDVMKENKAGPARPAGFWEPNKLAHRWKTSAMQRSRLCRLEMVKQPNRATPSPLPPPLASVHTCTAISKLINCESRSLETLNHSFSVLSQAANLAALTGVPPCLPNTGDGDGRGGGHGRFPVGGVAANRRGKQPMWTVRVGAKMSAAISRKMYNSDCEGVGFFGGWNNPTHWFHVHTHTPLPLC